MTLGGLWHGAALHFLVWGLFHGLLLAAHKLLQPLKEALPSLKKAIDSPTGRVLSTVLTFHMVCIGWVFFRAETNSLAITMLARMLSLSPALEGGKQLAMLLPTINYPLIYPTIFLILPLLAAGHIACYFIGKAGLLAKTPQLARAAFVLSMILAVVIFSPDKSPRFIYFQF